jgi:hypothetical protein
MVHPGCRLQGHRIVRDVGHETLRIAEVEIPGVEQGFGHESLRVSMNWFHGTP